MFFTSAVAVCASGEGWGVAAMRWGSGTAERVRPYAVHTPPVSPGSQGLAATRLNVIEPCPVGVSVKM